MFKIRIIKIIARIILTIPRKPNVIFIALQMNNFNRVKY